MRGSRITSAQNHPRYEQVEGDAGAEADDNNLFHLTTRQGEAAALILHPITQQKVKARQQAAMTCAYPARPAPIEHHFKSAADSASARLPHRRPSRSALASQWIPDEPALWKIENFREFLEARKALLAAEVNQRMEELLHGDTRWLAGPTATVPVQVEGGITSEEEEQLETLNDWMNAHGLPRGVLAYDFADAATGEQKALFDLAWPNGIQEELSQPVAVLLNEGAETIATASQAGYRCFTSITEFQRHVQTEVLAPSRPSGYHQVG